MSAPRHKHAAVRLKDRRILILGGSRTGSGRDELSDSTEIYDVTRAAFSAGPRMTSKRHKITDAVVTLPSGEVFIGGGAAPMERWRPGTPHFVAIENSPGNLAEFATVSLLSDGRALVLGGYDKDLRPASIARLF